MTTLTIVIKGIAVIVQRNDEWNVYMPFAGCHKAFLKRENEIKAGIILGHAGQKLSVSVGSNPSPLRKGANFEEFLDITGPEAHKDGVMLKFDWETDTVLFTIPGGTYSAELSQDSYVIKQANTTGAPTTDVGTIGTVGTIVLEGDDIRLTAAGRENFTWEFSEDTTIILDNDCGAVGGIHENEQPLDEKSVSHIDGKDNNKDFQLLYQVVVDAQNPGRMFNVESESGSGALPCNNHRVTKLIEF